MNTIPEQKFHTPDVKINSQRWPKYALASKDPVERLRLAHVAWDCLSYECDFCREEGVRRYHSLDGTVEWQISAHIKTVVFKAWLSYLTKSDEELEANGQRPMADYAKLRVHPSVAGEFWAKAENSLSTALDGFEWVGEGESWDDPQRISFAEGLWYGRGTRDSGRPLGDRNGSFRIRYKNLPDTRKEVC